MRALLLRLSFVCCLPGLFLVGHAQTATTPAPADFAAEPFAILNYSTVHSFKADGTSTMVQTGAVRIQSDSALREFGVLNLQFASQSQHAEFVYARVRHVDGTVLETPVNEAMEQPAPVTREAPFYSDLKFKQLPIKSLRIGDTVEWETRLTSSIPEAPGQFWGQYFFSPTGIVLDERLELHVPAGVHVNVWVNPKAKTQPEESTVNGEHIYVFHHASLKPTVGAAAEAATKAEEERIRTPEESLDESEGKLADIAWTTFSDWAAVGEWYRKLAAVRAVPDDTIKARVAELTAGKTTDQEKAEAIYNYVALQIRYIGVAFGIGRYQPHFASEVLANQYGDCKDKHTLLAAMLSAAGISSDAALIGAGIRFNQAVPSPDAFNHLITRAHIGSQNVWLDSTTEVAPFAALLYAIRDKPALVIAAAAAPVVERTPATLPYDAFSSLKVEGSLDNFFTSDSNITITLRGDVELIFRSLLRQTSAADYPDFVQKFMYRIGYAGTTSDPQIGNLLDTTKPLTISLHYHRLRSEDWGDNRIPTMFMPTDLPAVDEKKPPTSTLDLGYPHKEDSTEQMKLLEHWGAELPTAIHRHESFANCDITYRVANGILFAQRTITLLKAKLPQNSWRAYKLWFDDCGAGNVPFIQLTPPVASEDGKSSATPTVSSSNQKAAEMIWQANRALEAHDPVKALTLLDQAKDLSPQQRDLWGTYGYRAYDLGMPTEAVDDYRKEVLFHPDNAWVYAPLAEELFRIGKKQEAIDTIRKAIPLAPSNVRNNAMLVGLLESNGNTKEALDAGNAALKLIPPDNAQNYRFIMTMAALETKAGDKAAAAVILAPMVKVLSDPEEQNNVAYSLADLGLELPAAEAAERSALDSLTSQASAWTLEEDARTLKQKSSLIIASWDTLGWILFRQGRLKEAHSYISAAWRNRPDATLGLHLGDVEMAENDASAAFNTYQLALSTLPRGGGGTTNPAITALTEKLKAGIDRAQKAGGKSSIKDWHAAAQALRTIPLGPADGRTGSAEYRILLSQGKADGVRAESHGLPKADTLLLSTNFSDFIPPSEKTHILLSGFVNCLATTCELVIEP